MKQSYCHFNVCVVEAATINSVSELCFDYRHGDKGRILYQLNLLSMLTEALVLYDSITTFEPSPFRTVQFQSMDTKLVSYLNEREPGLICPYEMYEDQGAAVIDMKPHGVLYEDGSASSPEFLTVPRKFLRKNRAAAAKISTNVIVNSLASIGAEGELKGICKSDYGRFLSNYAANRLWHIESTRKVMDHLGATGTVIAPTLTPFWNLERDAAISQSHIKFALLQRTMATADMLDCEFDISPLAIVLLDESLEPEMIPEILLLLRRDYAELRTKFADYDKAIKAAKNYAERVEAIRTWEENWNGALSTISKKKLGLINRIVNWDVVKKGSLNGVFFNTVGETGKYVSELIDVKWGAKVAQQFHAEFLSSRLIRSRIQDLFHVTLD